MNRPAPTTPENDAPREQDGVASSIPGAAPASAAPDNLNPTSAEVFAAMHERGIASITIWADEHGDDFEVNGQGLRKTLHSWPAVLALLGLYHPAGQEENPT